jgi:hypothetical protein
LRKILNFNHKYSLVDLAGGIGAGGVAAKTVKVEGSLIKNEVKMVDNVSAKNVNNLEVSSTPTKLDPSEVRHSQNTVSYNKKDGEYTYDDIKNSMQKDGWQDDPIDVVEMPDGIKTSVDNSRVRAAKETDTTIEANVRKYDEPLSQDIIDSERFIKPEKNQNPTTWGEAATNRINNQSGRFAKDNPNGTHELPKVTGQPKE